MNYENLRGRNVDLSKIREHKNFERTKRYFPNFESLETVRLKEYVEHPERFRDFTVHERAALIAPINRTLSLDQRSHFNDSLKGREIYQELVKNPETGISFAREAPFLVLGCIPIALFSFLTLTGIFTDFDEGIVSLIMGWGTAVMALLYVVFMGIWWRSDSRVAFATAWEMDNHPVLTDESSDEEDSEEALALWRQANSDYDDVIRRISEYELDPEKAFKYPAFNDIGVEEVAEMARKLRAVKRVVSAEDRDAVDKVISGQASASTLQSREVLEDYRAAVDELHVAFQTAEQVAKKVGDTQVGLENQKLLSKALWLIRHAKDPATSDELSATYYQQLKKTVRKLNAEERIVPVDITEEIEHQARLSLSQAPTSIGDSVGIESSAGTSTTAEDLITQSSRIADADKMTEGARV